MKPDMTPLNEEQIQAIKNILVYCKAYADFIAEEMKKCPGLFEKCYEVTIDIDPRFLMVGKSISIYRSVISDGNFYKGITTEKYILRKGFDEFDKGWEESEICTKEFAGLFNGKTDGEGTGEGTGP